MVEVSNTVTFVVEGSTVKELEVIADSECKRLVGDTDMGVRYDMDISPSFTTYQDGVAIWRAEVRGELYQRYDHRDD